MLLKLDTETWFLDEPRQAHWWLIAFLTWGSFFPSTSGQDPFFSQFFNAPVYMNSAFSGISEQYNFSLNYRNQAPFFSDLLQVYNSYSFTADKFYKSYNSGLGVSFSGSQSGAGLIGTLNGAISYSYRVRLSGENYVRGGMEIGFISRKYGWNKFLFPDQLAPIIQGGAAGTTNELPNDQFSVLQPDFSFGILFHSPVYYAGISWKHLNTPDLSILRLRPQESRNIPLPLRWSVHGGYKWILSGGNISASYLSLNGVYVQQAALRQLNITALYKFSRIFAGVGLRHAFQNVDAAILSTGILIDHLNIGYSFDWTLSKFGVGNGGNHEVSLRYRLGDPVSEEGKTECYSFY